VQAKNKNKIVFFIINDLVKVCFFAGYNFSKILGRSDTQYSPYQHFGVEKGVLLSDVLRLSECW